MLSKKYIHCSPNSLLKDYLIPKAISTSDLAVSDWFAIWEISSRLNCASWLVHESYRFHSQWITELPLISLLGQSGPLVSVVRWVCSDQWGFASQPCSVTTTGIQQQIFAPGGRSQGREKGKVLGPWWKSTLCLYSMLTHTHLSVTWSTYASWNHLPRLLIWFFSPKT